MIFALILLEEEHVHRIRFVSKFCRSFAQIQQAVFEEKGGMPIDRVSLQLVDGLCQLEAQLAAILDFFLRFSPRDKLVYVRRSPTLTECLEILTHNIRTVQLLLIVLIILLLEEVRLV